jgi:ferric-dicitrate binding protein FerR (iron transport regulator)
MENLIRQYLEGSLSEGEQQKLLHWMKLDSNRAYFEEVKKIWWSDNIRQVGSDSGNAGALILSKKLKDKRQLQSLTKTLKIYKYAATFLILLSLSGLFYYYYGSGKDAASAQTEIFTENGQVSGVTLADGSKVWINSGTKLSYHSDFNKKNRTVKVVGEAFFSAAKNRKLPLIVDLGPLKVVVTGTRFGVSNYEDSATMNIVLEEGSVDVRSSTDQKLATLTPDEMIRFNRREKTIEKVKVTPEHFTSWRKGIIQIYEMPLKEVAIRLERRYNQKFVADPAVQHILFTFTIENESLPEVLNILEKIGSIKSEKKGEVIILK